FDSVGWDGDIGPTAATAALGWQCHRVSGDARSPGALRDPPRGAAAGRRRGVPVGYRLVVLGRARRAPVRARRRSPARGDQRADRAGRRDAAGVGPTYGAMAERLSRERLA